MHTALIAALCCALAPVQPPFAQDWSDTGLIATDDDWSRVPAMIGYRGDGLVAEPGTDPRTVLSDGSGTPVDVAANRTDPAAIGLAAGVAEFQLANPVVAIRGSGTASAPQLVIALDTSGRAGISVRMTLRDLDASADVVEPVAIQYRVGGTGPFANVPGGYVADATGATAAGATQATPVRALLPVTAENRALVEVRVLTTDAVGRDEWVGVDDIEVSAATVAVPGHCGGPGPAPAPAPQPWPSQGDPNGGGPVLTELSLSPETFRAARRGPAIVKRGRAGAALRFRLSKPALVRFKVRPGGERLRFQVRGRRGLNRMRFSGRIRGRALPAGAYSLTGVAKDRGARSSPPATIAFTIAGRQG